MVFPLQAARFVCSRCSHSRYKPGRREIALPGVVWGFGRVDAGAPAIGYGSRFAFASAISDRTEPEDDAGSKHTPKSRTGARKGKGEIFNKDLGKKPKIHLKPSLLSKTTAGSKETIVGKTDRKLFQQRENVNVAVETLGNAAQLVLGQNGAQAEVDGDSRAMRKIPAIYDSEDIQNLPSELPDALISVEAFFLARSVDLKSLAMEPSLNVMPCRNHAVIKLNATRSREDYTPMPGCLSNEKLVVVFQYGSVVLFNFDEVSYDDDFLKVVKKHSKEVFNEPKKDNYRVLVIPGLDKWSQGGSDKIMLKKLDMDGIRIISLVLGQSIALDHYTRSIDEMLNTFGELNRHMELTGTFNMKRKALFKLVAAANAALADAILRLGLLERSDAAWQSAKYDRIWEYMREDFELDDRFESLEFKIGIIQHNVKFFLDILQNRKSDTLEWIIIFLIAGEICVSVYDILRGTGAI